MEPPALGGVELPFPVGVVRAANLRFGQTSMEGLARRLVVVLNRSGAGCARVPGPERVLLCSDECLNFHYTEESG